MCITMKCRKFVPLIVDNFVVISDYMCLAYLCSECSCHTPQDMLSLLSRPFIITLLTVLATLIVTLAQIMDKERRLMALRS